MFFFWWWPWGLPSLCRGRVFLLALQGLISLLGVSVGFPSMCEGCLSCSELWLRLASCGWNAFPLGVGGCFLLAAGLAFLLWTGGVGLPSLGERSGLPSPFSAPSNKLDGSAMHMTDVRDVVGCRLQHTILCNCWLVVLVFGVESESFPEKKKNCDCWMGSRASCPLPDASKAVSVLFSGQRISVTVLERTSAFSVLWNSHMTRVCPMCKAK